MKATEHILLESDEREVPALALARMMHARLAMNGGLWRRSIELILIDYFYLSVRTIRSQSVTSFVLDLRFVDPAPRFSRQVAWRWMAASVVLLAAGIAVAIEIGKSVLPWWRNEWLPIEAALLGSAVCALFAAIYFTTETLTLFSAHGRAKLVEHTGGVGTILAFRRFRPKLDAHLRIAVDARRKSRAEHLRDEMREHFRLKCIGALSESEYEAAKRRILATHDPMAAGPRKQKARESPPGP